MLATMGRIRVDWRAPRPLVLVAWAAFAWAALGVVTAQEAQSPLVPYDRDLYEHWTDVDGDCQNTRHEVLISESLAPVTLDASGCRVVSGTWRDPFTGFVIRDPAELDIDHLVPLAEVHRSGGDTWNADRRREFANDLLHSDGLVAVLAAANRSKGDRDPARWLPPNEAFRCAYVRKWLIQKTAWGLAMDADEEQAVRLLLRACSGKSGGAAVGEEWGDEVPCQDINTADAILLEAVPGIGPSLAQAVLDYRTENGPFRTLEAVMLVRGIGETILERFREANFCAVVPSGMAGDSQATEPAVMSSPTVPFDEPLYEHWVDDDQDCQDAQQEALIARSVVPPMLDPGGCSVLKGNWFDPFTGRFERDRTQLEVGHLIPLEEVHRSGGDSWDEHRRREFANDWAAPEMLIVVRSGLIAERADRDPPLWLPPDERYHCEYVRRWVLVKTRWGLGMDVPERLAVREILAGCP